MGTEADPVDIAKAALEKAKAEGFDTLIVDTAGRQVIDDDLMEELKMIKKTVQPDETLLVVDAMTGQEAASLTAAFDSAVGLSGAILTKMDGDSRGGAAVSVRGVSGKPIKFVGTGERTPGMFQFFLFCFMVSSFRSFIVFLRLISFFGFCSARLGAILSW
jgi:signal recognition particle subunit SRP54